MTSRLLSPTNTPQVVAAQPPRLLEQVAHAARLRVGTDNRTTGGLGAAIDCSALSPRSVGEHYRGPPFTSRSPEAVMVSRSPGASVPRSAPSTVNLPSSIRSR